MISDQDINDKKESDRIKASIIPWSRASAGGGPDGYGLFKRLLGSEVVNIVGIGKDITITGEKE